MSLPKGCTPGPWRWCGIYLMHDCDAPDGGKIGNPYSTPVGRPIADDGSAGDEYSPMIETDGPDAHLIAAAPDLYEALTELLNYGMHEGPCDNDELDGFSACTLHIAASEAREAQARIALAKARGETV